MAAPSCQALQSSVSAYYALNCLFSHSSSDCFTIFTLQNHSLCSHYSRKEKQRWALVKCSPHDRSRRSLLHLSGSEFERNIKASDLCDQVEDREEGHAAKEHADMDCRMDKEAPDEGPLFVEPLFFGSDAQKLKNVELEALLKGEELLRQVITAKDAETALAIIADKAGDTGVVSSRESVTLMSAAIAENNIDLALSILNAMNKDFISSESDIDEGNVATQSGWRWAHPGAEVYSALIRGLASSLRITDAIEILNDMRRHGIPSNNEITFGKVINCPTCNIALAVVQSHHGIQLCACSKCRYHYELISGDVLSIESQAISVNISRFKRVLRTLRFLKEPVPAAKHSMLVKAPDGSITSHILFTASAGLPVQEKERVTVALAASSETGSQTNLFRISARPPGWQSHEPMSITNHATGNTTLLLHSPGEGGMRDAFSISAIFLSTILWTTNDFTAPLVDPTFARYIPIGVASAVAFGTAANIFILPQLSKVPQRTVDACALIQQLLMQYEWIQTHLEGLMQAAVEEIRLLAQMSHLQNKMEAVGKLAYSARIRRVSKAREGINLRLAKRLQLIYQYAKISSMIEIEVEIDTHLLDAEAAGATSNIAELIKRLLELEELQKQWSLQVEAKNEVEELIQSSYVP